MIYCDILSCFEQSSCGDSLTACKRAAVFSNITKNHSFPQKEIQKVETSYIVDALVAFHVDCKYRHYYRLL